MKLHPAQQYHAFTVTHSALANRILTLVGVTVAFDPISPPDPPLPEINCMALWDTGATASVITSSTVKALGLSPVGVVNVSHAGGVEQSNTYMVNIRLPNNVGIVGVLVSECSDNAGDFGAIIGMDIISQGDLSITNVGEKTVLSFRVPSIATIDYVVEFNRTMLANVGRNDPCPCGKMNLDGTRVKFKHCHGK